MEDVMSTRKIIIAALVATTTLAAIGIAAAQGFGPGTGGGRGAGLNPDAPWQQRLAAIDANGDGAISIAEMTTNAENVFTAMDADNDAALTKDEFMALRMGPQNGFNPARQAEMQARKAARFAPMDKNADGKVDKAEFTADVAARFKAADRNQDGRITPREFRAHAF